MNKKRYFEWLCFKINSPKAKPYFMLLSQLFDTEFIVTEQCPMDIRRAEDAKDLRSEFDDYYYNDEPANVLEVLVALVSRINDILSEPTDDQRPTWFWILIENLGLIRYTDNLYNWDQVSDILETWLEREYKWTGEGGLFPLKNPMHDQRFVDLWDQMAFYINENY